MALTLGALSSWNDYPILGPYGIGITTLTTVATQVLAPDSTRKGVFFHNPGAQNKRVLPAGQTAGDLAAAIAALVGGTGGILIYPQSDFPLLQGEDSRYNVNSAWVGVTDNNADGSLTILNFTPTTPGAPMVQMTMRALQQNPINSPVAAPSINVGTGSISILAPDPNRTGVIFGNPGTVNVAVTASNLSASIGAGSIVILPGGSKSIIGNSRVKVNCGWNGIAQSGNTNVITALGLYG
jgi:hypothetical protein